MPTLDFSEVANDVDLGQCFSVLRQSPGIFAIGGFQAGPIQTLDYFGVIGVATPKQLRMFPEGDRITGSEIVICNAPLYTTSESREATSDVILWHGQKYRVRSVAPWQDFGFQAAIVERLKGS
jgi:hypothetical protein